MANFGLIKSFGIDDGELDGVTVVESFVLGYELAQIDHLLESGASIHQPIHADNRERAATACVDANRQFRLTWLEGDHSESWLMLDVQAREK